MKKQKPPLNSWLARGLSLLFYFIYLFCKCWQFIIYKSLAVIWKETSHKHLGQLGLAAASKAPCTSFPWQFPNTIHHETFASVLGLVSQLILPDPLHFDAFIWLSTVLISQGRQTGKSKNRGPVLSLSRISARPQVYEIKIHKTHILLNFHQ